MALARLASAPDPSILRGPFVPARKRLRRVGMEM